MICITKIVLYTAVVVLLAAGAAQAQTFPATVNYTRTWTALAPEPSATVLPGRPVQDVLQKTQYYDGLGRLIQVVQKDQSPQKKDLVEMHAYDGYGREVNKYLQFAAVSAAAGDMTDDGNIKNDPVQRLTAFFSDPNGVLKGQNEANYASQVIYEASPLNRVSSVLPPGINWAGSGRGTSQIYLINTAVDNVQEWNIAAAQGSIPVSAGPYPAGSLRKQITVNENHIQSIFYTDKNGRVILKKEQLGTVQDNNSGSPHTGWTCTYFVYDDYGTLRFIISPKAVQSIDGSWVISQDLADELCFRYEYDNLNRMVINKGPGAAEIWIIYDKKDRPVLLQDGNRRALHQWLFFKYDAIDRPVIAGVNTDATNLTYAAKLQDMNNSGLALNEQRNNSISGAYTLTNSYPAETDADVLRRLYYDDYSWSTWYGSQFGAKDNSFDSQLLPASTTTFPYPEAAVQSNKTRGLVTGGWARNTTTGPGIVVSIFYDGKGRAIQTKTYNITGGTDIKTTQFAWNGRVVRSIFYQQKSGTNPQTHTLITDLTYDHAGRLLTTVKTLNSVINGQTVSSAPKTIAANSYDELGQLKQKVLGNGVDQQNYEYNIRGWLFGINRTYLNNATTIGGSNALPAAGNYFAEEVAFDKTGSALTGNAYTTAQFNGNITGSTWKSTGDAVVRKYNYVYDNVNRLQVATFKQSSDGGTSWNTNLDFSVTSAAYDANGNLTGLSQNGYRMGNANGAIDQLTFHYKKNEASNVLVGITDAANLNNSFTGDFHYDPATKQAQDYTFDPSGNLSVDNNKGITGSVYDNLNFPQQVNFGSKGYVQFKYAGPAKLQKTVYETNVTVTYNNLPYLTDVTTTTTYINGFVYQSLAYDVPALAPLQYTDVLQYITTEEGRIRLQPAGSSTPATYVFDYFIKDHLSDVRMVLTDQHQTDPYVATMETALATSEQALFGNIQQTRVAKPAGMDNDGTNQYVSKTNYTTARTGPTLVLKVMAGDKLSIRTDVFYNSTGGTNTNTGSLVVADILTNLIAGLSGTGAAKGTLTDLQNNTVLPTSAQSYLQQSKPFNGSYPKAYLNYLFLDEQFNYVSGSAIQVSLADAKQTLFANPLPVLAPKNGYVYVYVSNESNYDVFFDNFQVNDDRSPIVEETHYYPYGLTMAGISSKALRSNYVINKYQFNGGGELQNREFSNGSGIDAYDAVFRSFDPQIGRFQQIDPFAAGRSNFSPYSYGADNPILNNDKSGLWSQFYSDPFTFGNYGNTRDEDQGFGADLFDIATSASLNVPTVNAFVYNKTTHQIILMEGVSGQDQLKGTNLQYIGQNFSLTDIHGVTTYYSAHTGDAGFDATTTNPHWGDLPEYAVVGHKKSVFYEVNDRIDQSMVLTSLSMDGAQRLANYVGKTKNEIIGLGETPVLGVVGKLAAGITVGHKLSQFIDDPKKHWVDGVEAVGTLLVAVFFPEAELAYALITTGVDLVREHMEKKEGEGKGKE